MPSTTHSPPDWSVLGIEPTQDKRAIKKAYAKQLKQIDPQADQAAFKTLRAAYDAALAFAEAPNTATEAPAQRWAPKAYQQPVSHYRAPERDQVGEYFYIVAAEGEACAIEAYQSWVKAGVFESLQARDEFEMGLLNTFVRTRRLFSASMLFFNEQFNWQEKFEQVNPIPRDQLQQLIYLLECAQYLQGLTLLSQIPKDSWQGPQDRVLQAAAKAVLMSHDALTAQKQKFPKKAVRKEIRRHIDKLIYLVRNDVASEAYDIETLQYWLRLPSKKPKKKRWLGIPRSVKIFLWALFALNMLVHLMSSKGNVSTPAAQRSDTIWQRAVQRNAWFIGRDNPQLRFIH